MKVYHVEFAKLGKGMSGGETWMVEVIRHLRTRGVQNVLLTTDNGRETYERLGLGEGDGLSYQTIGSYRDERRYPTFISYLLRTVQAGRLVRRLRAQDDDVIICHSEFFPNSIPFRLLAGRSSARLICLFHMLAPSVFRGYEGQFTGRLQIPRPNVVHYKLNQWLYFRLIPTRAVIVTNSDYVAKVLRRHSPGRSIRVLARYAGAEERPAEGRKSYDLLWMGRFHPQKGLLEVPEIIELVRRRLPDVKALIVGGGDDGIEREFRQEVSRRKLDSNVEMAGVVMGERKYQLINRSRLFLMTSTYESLGIVNLEALKNGVPVAAYDMPVFSLFTRGMRKVPMLDRQALADEIVELLGDPERYARASAEARSFAADFSWQRTADELYRLLDPDPAPRGERDGARA
jgi:glycosyltransferase involved in cell wall biosynthesis